MGLLLLVWGCSSTLDPATGDIRLDLKHKDPRIRILAAERCVDEDREDLVANLVENLDDGDPAVRMFTGVALRKLTGRDFGYTPYGSPAEREEAIRQWKVWIGSKDSPGAASASEGTEAKVQDG